MAELGGGCLLRVAQHAACIHSSDPTLRAMWPDGHQDITEVTKRPLTAGTLFKNSMVALVENLASKVPASLAHPVSFQIFVCAWVSSQAPTCLCASWGGGVFPLCCEPPSSGDGPAVLRLRGPGAGW